MAGDPLAPHQGPVMGRSLMVASAHAAASETGLSVMRSGGNAVDAAVAISFLLCVLKPARCALGGDLFYLVYSAADGTITAINGSGVAPRTATLDAYADGIPARGIRSAAVPGFVDGVLTAHRLFATRPLAELVEPAIAFAREGFPVSLRLASLIAEFEPALRAHAATAAVFLPGSRVPALGEVLRQPDLARTLEAIRDGGAAAFYRDGFARALITLSDGLGGHFHAEDLTEHATEVREPISVQYRGHTVYGQPPVSQGHILLEELGILDGFDLAGRAYDDPQRIHLMLEAKKLAFADMRRYAGDPRRSSFTVERLLAPEFLAQRRAAIDPERASAAPAPGRLEAAVHDTTSFAVVDGQGNAVAAIQSVFQPWGSGIVVDGTGVLLNNRLTGFVLEPGHPNALEPGRRPVHTLNNYIVTKDGRPVLVGGTPGGQQQVQTNMQLLSAVLDLGLDVQTANDLPRWGHTAGVELELEARFDPALDRALEGLGHRPRRIGAWEQSMGRACVIALAENGARMGSVDLRAEGTAAGW